MPEPSINDFTFIKDRLEKIRKEEGLVSTPDTTTDSNKVNPPGNYHPGGANPDLTDYSCCLSVDDGSVYYLHKNLVKSTIEVWGTGRINANGFLLKDVKVVLTNASTRMAPHLVFVGLAPAYTSSYYFEV